MKKQVTFLIRFSLTLFFVSGIHTSTFSVELWKHHSKNTVHHSGSMVINFTAATVVKSCRISTISFNQPEVDDSTHTIDQKRRLNCRKEDSTIYIENYCSMWGYYVTTPQKIKKPTINQQLVIIPSVSTNLLSLEGIFDAGKKVRIVNKAGLQVYSTDITHHATLNTSDWPEGMYVVEFTDPFSLEKTIERILVQH